MADDLFVKRAETFIVEHEGFYYEPKTFVRHKEESYFETSLLRNNGICVGFVPRNENSGVVGWTTSSYGVEGSGELLREGELVLKIPPFSAGDTIACSWDKKSGLVNFFLNRERLGEQLVAPVDARMFPAGVDTVAFAHYGGRYDSHFVLTGLAEKGYAPEVSMADLKIYQIQTGKLYIRDFGFVFLGC
uniref:B30.2/SPRY domain-containing protein n=1 Tax=Globodera rostochiensis TaxID=31243 RepID=A0A914HPJ9_GLORO